jgi:hypothetical protein
MSTITGYQIMDKETGRPATRRIYEPSERHHARRKADRMDNQHGGYRYTVTPIYSN